MAIITEDDVQILTEEDALHAMAEEDDFECFIELEDGTLVPLFRDADGNLFYYE